MQWQEDEADEWMKMKTDRFYQLSQAIDDEWQQEQEQMMMIIARICYNKRWQEWCMIDEDDAMNEDFNNNKAFENKNDNNECDDRQTNKIFQIKCDAVANEISIHFNDFFKFNFLNFLQL